MKFGIRKPSLKKSLSAKFSVKRKVKNAFGLKAPKGMGVITNPKKHIYNKVYNKTTFSIFNPPKMNKSKSKKQEDKTLEYEYSKPSTTFRIVLIFLNLFGFIGIAGIHRLITGHILSGIIYLFSFGIFGIGTLVDLILLLTNSFTIKKETESELKTANSKIINKDNFKNASKDEIDIYNEYLEMDCKYKKWLTCNDDYNLPEENQNEAAGVIPMEEPFPSGHFFPSQLGKDCRSGLIYGWKKEELE